MTCINLDGDEIPKAQVPVAAGVKAGDDFLEATDFLQFRFDVNVGDTEIESSKRKL